MFWTIFGILGVQIFAGRFYDCNDKEMYSRQDCVGAGMVMGEEGASFEAREWKPPSDRWGFDDIGSAVLTLFEVSTLERWLDIMCVPRRHHPDYPACLPSRTPRAPWLEPLVPVQRGGENSGVRLPRLARAGRLQLIARLPLITPRASLPPGRYLATDATELGRVSEADASPVLALFFIVFILFGSFFMLELFVGAIVASYSKINEESAGMAFQSERQKRLVAKMVLRTKKDEYLPVYTWQQELHTFTTSELFHRLITALIILNIFIMASYRANMSQEYLSTLDTFNDLFTLIFALEAAMKMAALTPVRYFRSGMNKFDFFVVLVTSLEFMLNVFLVPAEGALGGGVSSEASVLQRLAKVLRIFRIARVLRLLGKIKGLVTLFLAVMHALPTIINVGSVLMLVFFIYAVLGMHLFGKVMRGDFLDDHTNFETFGTSLLTVMRMATGESWNGIMNDCRVQPPDCDPLVDCGSPVIAPVYFTSFQICGTSLPTAQATATFVVVASIAVFDGTPATPSTTVPNRGRDALEFELQPRSQSERRN